MPEFDEKMVAGFQSAHKAGQEARPTSEQATAAAQPIRAKRHRDTRTQPRDPAASQIIDSRDLRQILDRLVRLTEEKGEVQDSIKAEFASAKEKGFDPKALRIVIKRAMEDEAARAARAETEDSAEAMMRALGMFADTPLGEAAVRSATY